MEIKPATKEYVPLRVNYIIPQKKNVFFFFLQLTSAYFHVHATSSACIKLEYNKQLLYNFPQKKQIIFRCKLQKIIAIGRLLIEEKYKMIKSRFELCYAKESK